MTRPKKTLFANQMAVILALTCSSGAAAQASAVQQGNEESSAASADVPGGRPVLDPAARIMNPRPVYDPRTGQSPMVLLDVPEDGIEYHRTRLRARALYDRAREEDLPEQYRAAEPLLERITREYPRDPLNWLMLANTRLALDKHLEAAAAFERAGALWGWDVQTNAGYRAVISYYEAGERRKALDLLRALILNGHAYHRTSLLRAPTMAALRDDPEFLELIGHRDTSGWTREEGWRHDIDWLYEEIKRTNPDYRDSPFPPEFVRRYEELKRNVPNLTDEEIFVGMQRMLFVLHQGHLVLWADESARTPNRYLPMRFYAFPEGIFIIDAAEGYSHLIGSRVETFGSLSADQLLLRLALAHSVDGSQMYVGMPARMSETYFLKGLGAIDAVASVTLQVRHGDGGTMNVVVETVPQLESRLDVLAPPAGVAPPLFLQNVQQAHWDQALPQHDALYVQVNALVHDRDETLPQFGERLWSVLAGAAPKNLILDLRHNNGGTTQLYPELLRTLIAFSRIPGNQVYVITGRRTFSAAGNLITDLERLADPIFVGEPASECCNLYGDPTFVRLPYSGIMGELVNVKWQLSYPFDRRREIVPDVPVQLSAQAFFAGEDTVLESVLQLIGDSRAADAGSPGLPHGAVQ